ncbi:MAG: hypothetical protein IKT26_06295 [Bacteroidaceae bacterium]|nr:hypothetical protein [Bacteroidaceae bacterium]
MQGECRTKQKLWFLFFMPSRSLTWAKPKYARRVESQTCLSFFIIVAALVKTNKFILSSLAHHFQSAVRLEPSRARKCFLGGTSSSGMGRFSARRLEFSASTAENSKRLADFRLVRFVCRGGFQDIFKVYPAVCYIDLSI